MKLSIFVDEVIENIKNNISRHSVYSIVRGINKVYHFPKYIQIYHLYEFLKNKLDKDRNITAKDYLLGLIIGTNFKGICSDEWSDKCTVLEFYDVMNKLPKEELESIKSCFEYENYGNGRCCELYNKINIMKLLLYDFNPSYDKVEIDDIEKIKLDYISVGNDKECIDNDDSYRLSTRFIECVILESKLFAQHYFIKHDKPKTITNDILEDCKNNFSKLLYSFGPELSDELKRLHSEFYGADTTSDEEEQNRKVVKSLDNINYENKRNYYEFYGDSYIRIFGNLDEDIKTDVKNIVKLVYPNPISNQSILKLGFYVGDDYNMNSYHGYIKIYPDNKTTISIKIKMNEHNPSWTLSIKMKQ